jgi:ubiquitin carboxyl-terminal hydrolase 10
MADFVFGDFSEQEAEKLFDNDKQGVKFPWGTDDCMNTAIEFGFDIPQVISPSGGTGVSYSCNGSLSHQESTNSALTSPPYSSKSSSVENVKISKQSSSHTRHHSDRKLKKKRPPGYYTQEYQQMLEPSTLENHNQKNPNEQTPQIEQNSNDERYISCEQWVDSTMQHQHDDKQSTNDEDEIESDSPETTTDTDNDSDQLQTIKINKTLSNNNNNNNETSLYSTSVASAASIETLKPSSDNLSSSSKSKPSSWAALFRGSQPTTQTTTNLPSVVPQTQQSTSVQKAQTTATTTTSSSSSPQTQQNGGRTNTTNNTNFYPKTNYHVYNSNGEDSRTLEDYFSKCEVRPSAMAIKPRGLQNKSNYCYVNATLQSLLACPAFFNVMKYIPLNEDTDNHNVPCIRALHSFVNQFEKMDRSKSNSNHKDIICGTSFEPADVLQELSRLRHTPVELVKSKQEDAHELLCQLLSEIHDEICQILYNPSSNKNEESTSSSDLSTLTADLQLNGDEKSEDWLQVGKRNRTHVLRTNEIRKSLITDIFAGKFRSIVHSAGNQKSVVHEPFFTLSLDIKDPKITTLDDALLRFCEQSTVSDYIDSKNRQNIHTNKTMLIEQLPPILIIHLKCFLYDETDGIKKINKSVNYTVNLTLPKNILTEQARKHSYDRYKLFAVEYHQGDHATKGHYITDVFHPGLQGWLRFDDGNVQVVSSTQVINPTADKLTPYLLFYRRD